MLSKNSARTIRQIVAGALVMIASGVSFAGFSTVLLPPENIMTTGTYGDFQVQSLELNAECAAALDPNCLPSGPYPVQSSGGQVSENILIYQGASNSLNYPIPLNPLAPAGDNAFNPTTGVGDTYQFNTTDEPNSASPYGTTGVDNQTKIENTFVPGFTGDQSGTWELQLGALAHFLKIDDADSTNDSSLVFLFANNQTGASASQWLWMFATAAILDSSGALMGDQCYGLYGLNWNGICKTSSTTEIPSVVAPVFDDDNLITNLTDDPITGLGTSYIGIVGDFCVYKDPANPNYGMSYNIGTGSVSSCGTDYYIKNNLGQSEAAFAAYNVALENWVIQNWQTCGATTGGCVLSIDARFANLNNGGETLWLGANIQRSTVPEPGSLALLGLGFVAMSLSIRRSKLLRK